MGIETFKPPSMPPVKPPRAVLPNMKENLPNLIAKLGNINTQYSVERQYIGEAISYLRLMQDMIE